MDSGVGAYLAATVSYAISVVSSILMMNRFIAFCDQLLLSIIGDHFLLLH